ncbi:MAG: Kelch repeat-containing protein, partial [Planctomycetota bacterium]
MKRQAILVLAILLVASLVPVCKAVPLELVRQSDSPVLDTGGPSPYESYHVLHPSVSIQDGIYKMWYWGYRAGPSPRGGICYATSEDKGLTWTKHGTVLEVTEEWERNSPPETYNQLNYPTVVYEEGMYKMWYNAGGASLGYVTSTDGINWYNKTQQLGHGYVHANVVKGPSDYKLYYYKSGVDGIYAMESSDGGVSDPWEVANQDNPVLEPGALGEWDSSVVFQPNVRYEPETGKFQMWYSGDSTTGARCIGFALSDDGLTWEKDITNPVLEPVPGTWERDAVMPGSVVFDSSDSMYRMFYGGYHHDHWAIGLAAAAPEPPCTGCTLCPWQLHGQESDMVVSGEGFGDAVLGGYIYAIGGQAPGTSYGTNRNQRYNPVAHTWVLRAPMPTSRHSLDCAVVDGYIYAIGGHVYNSRSENERYDPSTDTWASMAHKPTAVSGPGIAAFGGKIYTFGGNRYGSRQSVIEVYDPCTNTWPPELVDHMPAAGEPWAAATLGDKIYLAGGSFQGSADHLWCYDPATRLWDTNLPKLNIPRSAHELVVVNDCLFAIGGSGPPLNSVEWWRPGDTHWTLDESLNVARGYLGAESISNTIYAFGGVESGILSSVESAVICEPTAIPVTLDIKPGSCPNPLNLNSKGVLPVAILGSADFDVNQIDIASIRLADVAPIRSSYEDVATPVSDGNECDCNTAGSD